LTTCKVCGSVRTAEVLGICGRKGFLVVFAQTIAFLARVKLAFAACGQTVTAVWLILQAAIKKVWLPGTMTPCPLTAWRTGFVRQAVNVATQNTPMFQEKNTGIIT